MQKNTKGSKPFGVFLEEFWEHENVEVLVSEFSSQNLTARFQKTKQQKIAQTRCVSSQDFLTPH